MWQFMKRGIVVAAGLVMAMSFLGDLHGLGDRLAVFRTAILLGCGGVDSVALARGTGIDGSVCADWRASIYRWAISGGFGWH